MKASFGINIIISAYLSQRCRRGRRGGESLLDRARLISERRQWYLAGIYTEPRLCRYRDTMRWHPNSSFPFNAGFIAKERLPIRHYPHRDPAQLERRCCLRAIMMADVDNRRNWAQPELHHWAETEWRKFITPDHAPNLKQWELGSSLPEIHERNHLTNSLKRSAQRVVHAALLPMIDRMRKKCASAYPKQIPGDLQQLLEESQSRTR